VLAGVFNFRPDPTVLQVIGWAAYLVIVMTAFLWPIRRKKASTPPAPAPTSATV
jgi:high-affinity iron transporter